jgi:hypothetical protein
MVDLHHPIPSQGDRSLPFVRTNAFSGNEPPGWHKFYHLQISKEMGSVQSAENSYFFFIQVKVFKRN